MIINGAPEGSLGLVSESDEGRHLFEGFGAYGKVCCLSGKEAEGIHMRT